MPVATQSRVRSPSEVTPVSNRMVRGDDPARAATRSSMRAAPGRDEAWSGIGFQRPTSRAENGWAWSPFVLRPRGRNGTRPKGLGDNFRGGRYQLTEPGCDAQFPKVAASD